MTQSTIKPRFPANPDAPRFEPYRWRLMQNDDGELDVRGLTVMSNCYQYAVAGSARNGSNMVYHEAIPNPGEFGGKLGPLYTKKAIREAVENDGLSTAPFVVSNNKSFSPLPEPRSGYYLVGMYTKNLAPTSTNPHGKRDYHFVRQDSDGGWSHKPGQGMFIQVSRLLEPDAEGGYRPLPAKFGENKDYKFAGYAYVPREGVDAGPEQPLIRALLAAKVLGEDKCWPAKTIISHRLPDDVNDESYFYQLEQAVNIGIAMRKHGIREAAEAYEACLIDYTKNPDKSKASIEREGETR